MKIRWSWLVLLCLSAAPAFPQSAPDRAGDVDRVVRAHPEFLTGDDGRRQLLAVIACDLNVRDNGNWGRLTKLDQGGKIPADILVWRPTREHFDVLTDTGPMWGPDGVLDNPSWQWSPVACVSAPPPVTPPPYIPPPPVVVAPVVDLAPLEAKIDALIASTAADHAAILAAANEPGWLKKFVTNRYVQIIGAAVLAKYAPALWQK